MAAPRAVKYRLLLWLWWGSDTNASIVILRKPTIIHF